MEVLIPEKEKRSVAPSLPDVCFVCTGNTCRSPMAEVVYNTLSGGAGRAISRGLFPQIGSPVSENAVLSLEKAGYPTEEVRRRGALPLDADTASRVGKIVCMTPAHAMELLSLFPSQAEKITVFPVPVSDPFGGGPGRYDACLKEIESGIEELFGLKKR